MTFLLVYGARFNKRHIGRGNGRRGLMTAESRDEESWQKSENKPSQACHHGYCHRLEWQPLMISSCGNAMFITCVRVRPASDSSDLDDDVTENEKNKFHSNGTEWLRLAPLDLRSSIWIKVRVILSLCPIFEWSGDTCRLEADGRCLSRVTQYNF